MERRLLTPAEAALLLAPSASTGSKCIQAGLLSLISAGRIAVEQASGLLKPSTLRLNAASLPTATPLPCHLIALEQSLHAYGKGNHLVSSQVLHALQKRFAHGFSRYVHEEVAPGLVKRDLLTRRESKWLGLFPRITYQRTARGEALIAPINSLMSAVEQVPSLIDRDPDQAVRLALSAGVLLVMSSKARRQIPALRKLIAERGDDLAPIIYLPIDDESEGKGRLEQLLELGDMALAFEIEGLFDGIDAVCDFTSGGDSSSSDGGDGGGGD